MKEHRFKQPSIDEKKEIMNQTGWNIHQLNHQLLCERSVPGEVTMETKKILLEWMKQRGATPSKADKIHLLRETGWNRKQLNYQIRKNQKDFGTTD